MRRALGLLCGLMLILAGCASGHGSTPPPNPPPVSAKLANAPLIVFPTMDVTNIGGSYYQQACMNPTQWPIGWAKMQGMGMAIEFWDAWVRADPASVIQCFANLKAANKGIVIEAWALKPPGVCTTAQACWDGLSSVFAEIAALNPPPMTVAIDEPLTGSASYDTPAQAVTGTAQWIGLLRAAYPGTPIILDETYPGNDAQTLVAYYTAVNAKTAGGIQYAALDHNWQNSPLTDPVLQIAAGVRAAGMKFEAIMWDASTASPPNWSAGVAYQTQIYAKAGITADLWCIEDWVGFPSAIVPETDPASFTGSVATFISMLQP